MNKITEKQQDNAVVFDISHDNLETKIITDEKNSVFIQSFGLPIMYASPSLLKKDPTLIDNLDKYLSKQLETHGLYCEILRDRLDNSFNRLHELLEDERDQEKVWNWMDDSPIKAELMRKWAKAKKLKFWLNGKKIEKELEDKKTGVKGYSLIREYVKLGTNMLMGFPRLNLNPKDYKKYRGGFKSLIKESEHVFQLYLRLGQWEQKEADYYQRVVDRLNKKAG